MNFNNKQHLNTLTRAIKNLNECAHFESLLPIYSCYKLASVQGPNAMQLWECEKMKEKKHRGLKVWCMKGEGLGVIV